MKFAIFILCSFACASLRGAETIIPSSKPRVVPVAAPIGEVVLNVPESLLTFLFPDGTQFSITGFSLSKENNANVLTFDEEEEARFPMPRWAAIPDLNGKIPGIGAQYLDLPQGRLLLLTARFNARFSERSQINQSSIVLLTKNPESPHWKVKPGSFERLDFGIETPNIIGAQGLWRMENGGIGILYANAERNQLHIGWGDFLKLRRIRAPQFARFPFPMEAQLPAHMGFSFDQKDNCLNLSSRTGVVTRLSLEPKPHSTDKIPEEDLLRWTSDINILPISKPPSHYQLQVPKIFRDFLVSQGDRSSDPVHRMTAIKSSEILDDAIYPRSAILSLALSEIKEAFAPGDRLLYVSTLSRGLRKEELDPLLQSVLSTVRLPKKNRFWLILSTPVAKNTAEFVRTAMDMAAQKGAVYNIITFAPPDPAHHISEAYPTSSLSTEIDFLTERDRATFIAQELEDTHSIHISPVDILDLNQSIRAATQGERDTLGTFESQFSTLIQLFSQPHKLREGVQDRHNRDSLVQLYLKLSGWLKPDRPSPETIESIRNLPRLFSASSPRKVPGALSDREGELNGFFRRLATYLSEELPKNEPGFFTLLGDTGTGKSKLVDLIREHVQEAVVETVSASSLDKLKETQSGHQHRDAETILLADFREKIFNLRQSDKPIKILMGEEINAFPPILRHLLPAAGDSDRSSATLNLSGIVTIIAGNVNTNSDAYQQLTRLQWGEPRYTAQVLELFKATFKGRELPDHLVNAIGGRLASNMFFFRPLKTNKTQMTVFVREILDEIGREYGCRLVPEPESIELLADAASEVEASNYRVERNLRGRILEAFTLARLRKPDIEFKGRVFRLGPDPASVETVKPLVLSRIDNTPDGNFYRLEDVYRRINESFTTSIRLTVETLSTLPPSGDYDPERELVENTLLRYSSMLEAARLASSAPLFTHDRDGILQTEAFDWKSFTLLNERQRHDFNQFLRTSFEPLFSSFLNSEEVGTLSREKEQERLDLLNKYIGGVNRLIDRLFVQAESKHPGMGESWIKPATLLFFSSRSGQTRERALDLELSFMKDALSQWEALQRKQLERNAPMHELAKFGQSFATRLSQMHSNEEVDHALLERFLNDLMVPPSSQYSAKATIEQHENSKQRPVGKEKLNFRAIAAAFEMDRITRDFLSAEFANYLARHNINHPAAATSLVPFTVGGHKLNGHSTTPIGRCLNELLSPTQDWEESFKKISTRQSHEK